MRQLTTTLTSVLCNLAIQISKAKFSLHLLFTCVVLGFHMYIGENWSWSYMHLSWCSVVM